MRRPAPPRREVVRLFIKEGGTVIDSSPMYGEAERVTGDLLADLGLQSKVFLATKVWTSGRESGIRQMSDSMRLLRAKKIDLMQVHNLSDTATQLRTLHEWKGAGKIRYIGITHYTASALDDLAEWIKRDPEIAFVQFPYSIAVLDAERRFLPFCADKGVATLVNRPYENGGLFRAVRGMKVPEWAREFGAATWGQFFLKYILSTLGVTCVIPATRKPKHLLDNMDAGRGPPAVRRRAAKNACALAESLAKRKNECDKKSGGGIHGCAPQKLDPLEIHSLKRAAQLERLGRVG